MTEQHTPGPWWFAQVDYEGNCIAGAGNHEFTVELTRPDARLIAAAPNMLKALEAVAALPGFEPDEPYGKLVLAAIAQAR